MSRYRKSCHDHCDDHHGHHHHKVDYSQEVVYIEGPAGPRGKQGPMGCEGPPGRDGRDGSIGPMGHTGPPGEQGCAGVAGPEGARGPAGDDGKDGKNGQDGRNGIDGKNGINGVDGKSCAIDGTLSADGTQLQVTWYSDGAFVDSETLTAPVGPQGPIGLTGPKGEDGADGAQGPQGPSGIVSCTLNETGDCYDVVLMDQNGNEKSAQFSPCVTSFSCGYTGSPICVTPSGTAVTNPGNGTNGDGTQVTFNYPIDTANFTFMAFAGNAGTVSNVTTSIMGDYSCVQWDQTGSFDYQIFHDTTGLPTATKGDITCYPPHQPDIYATAPSTVAYNRGLGGSPTGWLSGGQADGTQSSEGYTAPDYYQNFDQYVMGGAFSGTFTVDEGQTATISVCYRHCYYEPVAAETNIAGDIIVEACDSNGVFTPDNTTVLV